MQNQTPHLRFPEFKGDWGNKKLGDVCKKIQDGNYGGEYPKPTDFIKTGVPFLTSKAVGQSGEILNEKIDYISIEKHSSLKKAQLKLNDVLFTNRGSNVGSIALVSEKISNGNIGPQLTLLRCNNDVNYRYLKQVMISNIIQKQVNANNSGSAMNFFGIGETAKFIIPVTSFDEQTKIATFLTAVDEKLTALKQKKSLLSQYKKGAMQKIFSQELRFKDDNGNDFADWEERNLGEIYTFKTTNSFSRENLNYESGEVKNIHYGDIHTKFQSRFDILHEKVPFINSEISIQRILDDNYCKEGDLVIADASEDYADIGKSIEIVNLNSQKTLAGLHTLLARPDLEKISLGFGSCFMKSEKMRSQIMKIAQGSKVLSISISRMKNVGIELPLKQEQTKIANFLSAIDDKINLCNNEIAQIQTWKKGLLQQLFV